jgi:hypothetical protein
MKVMQERFPTRLPELVISLGTGMRLVSSTALRGQTWTFGTTSSTFVRARTAHHVTFRWSDPVKDAFTVLSKASQKMVACSLPTHQRDSGTPL